MDFSFTDEQTMLRESVGRYLEKHYDFHARQALIESDRPYSEEVWKQFAEFGLLALPFAEEARGLGGSIVDVVAVAEKFGAFMVIEPYVSSILLGGRALALAADHAGAQAWLSRIMAGEALACFAHEEGKGTANPALVTLSATRSGDDIVLQGEKRLVLGGSEADVIVVSARAAGTPGDREGLALLLVEAGTPGVVVRPFDTIDGRRAAHVQFEGVRVPPENLLITDACESMERIIADTVIALSAEAVGAMGALLRMTSEYASIRKQFGVPLATFQVVAHRLADMKIAATKALSTLLYTTALAEAGRLSRRDLAVLKGQTGRLGRAIAEASIQTHGGIGMTDELAAGHFLKRLLVNDALFGSGEYHLRVVGAGTENSRVPSEFAASLPG